MNTSMPNVVRVLVDFTSPDPGTPALRAEFKAPSEVFFARSAQQVPGVLDAVHARAKAGSWCVGFVSYEAAPAFDSALLVHSPAPGYLAWFGVFDDVLPWCDETRGSAKVEWHTPLRREDARVAICDIHRRIAEGEVYQINHTARMKGTLQEGGPLALFAALRRAQPDAYAAYLDTGAQQVLSVSPELFFDWREDGQILARPMKGTAARGATPGEDAQNAAALRASAKERAENVMIVDLIRNDLSRIAEPHSVSVPRLFHTEALPTVWSMTSDVVARTRPDVTLPRIFDALFPCGSVTGAPKVQAMRTICALEPDARGVYCGAVGVVRPGGAATFNVAIRTVEIHGGTQANCGIGSGITIDAGFESEWAEWSHKAAFVRRASAPFSLLETLRIESGVVRNAQAHVARLAASAAHFSVPFDADAVARALTGLARTHPAKTWHARLLVHADGQVEASASLLQPPRVPVRVRLAARAMRETYCEFVRHKTTRRTHYEAFSPADGLFDTLLWNEAGEVTEFTRGNVAVKLGGRWITPSLACGLLPGIARGRAIALGSVTEGVVRVEDLRDAEGVVFVSSLLGWIEVTLEHTEEGSRGSAPDMRTCSERVLSGDAEAVPTLDRTAG
ncbi:aminodeoxychorismate synthase component I [Paraburkholderia sacchari]|uniref:aminodeoxychorismate synthase component I n=1 Tax=Paraburkholderia sacchari TaxID=159450 RepID=UPI003D999926